MEWGFCFWVEGGSCYAVFSGWMKRDCGWPSGFGIGLEARGAAVGDVSMIFIKLCHYRNTLVNI